MENEQGMIAKHLQMIKELGFYYELVHLMDLQRKECLQSIMKTEFYMKHKNDFPKSYILAAPMPKEVDNWKQFKPNSGQNDEGCDTTDDAILTDDDKIKNNNQND